MGSETSPLPPGTAIGRVALVVADPNRVAAFYERTVGLAVQERTADRLVLGDGETGLLELHGDPDAPERAREETGLYHVAIRVPTRAALGAALERIESTVGLDGASDHHVSEALYLRDPEGNGVEIYCDRPQSEWAEHEDGTVRMGTDPLDRGAVAAASDGTDTVPAGTDVGHVHLEVADLDATRSFYADRLGMAVRASYPGALFLAAGGYHHHVGANVWHRRSAPGEGRGLAWYELVVPDAGTLAAVRARVEAQTATDRGFETTDPAGIRVRFRTP